MTDLKSLFPFLEEINREAGKIVRRYFGTRLDVRRKSDFSPVTKADLEVEAFLRAALEQRFPHHSILGEEFGESRKGDTCRWIIDPIDGTKSFILNTPLFGTLMALEVGGVPVLGSIYLPIQDQFMVGSAETGTYVNGERCSVSETSRLADATLLITDPADLSTQAGGKNLNALCDAAGMVRGFGDCYGYFLVASGVADVMLDPSGLSYHDVAPLLPVIEGAGGNFSAINGRIDLNHPSGLATNGRLHQEVLRLLS